MLSSLADLIKKLQQARVKVERIPGSEPPEEDETGASENEEVEEKAEL